jgi:hypothetical protein
MISQEFKEPEFGSVVFRSLFLEILWADFFRNTFQTVELSEILKFEKKLQFSMKSVACVRVKS